MESNVVISSIWEDESLFEVKVSGSNGKFTGEATCYTNRENILELAEILEVFPQKLSDSFNFSTGKNDGISYFSISGFRTDGSGHILLAIEIAHIVSFTNARTQNYKASFDLRAEPEGVNQFGRQLRKVACEPLGKTEAVLNNAT
ncbi:hypothetical protein [Pseudoalteromonas marina]|jgi:hypothetical protein|uniref:Uncharacterized protein n=1 Tax=Pseudoalteromonas marina TaxID=267375 RepID=A0ABT9FCP7_9GAMM|nr:hypothetical protein [Pseudoalteromonas marina]MDP2485697.1 hypothetical protein [Pseudoalteromonas marina]MDP2564513.1 hypothetical protein [Pseudoalteromonas marina]